MFRVLLTAVLMLLIALPHGICLCPHAPAAEPIEQHCCRQAEPEPQPSDQNDDHERDCSCKLTQVLASADATRIEHDPSVIFLSAADAFGSQTATALDADACRSLPDASDTPLARIPCALRI